MTLKPHLSKPRVGLLPIGRIRDDHIRQDYEFGLKIIRLLDAEIVESPLVWEDTQVLESIATFQTQRIHLLVIYVLHGMSAVQQTLAGVNAGVPIVLWSLPQNFSFPSSANAVGALRERGKNVKLVLAPSGDDSVIAEIAIQARAAYTLSMLRNSRIGTIGSVFPNLTASHYHRDVLAEKIGPETVHIPISELKKYLLHVNGSPKIEIDKLRENFVIRANNDLLQKAIPFQIALNTLAIDHGLDVITLECYSDLIPLFGINLCLGLSLLDRDYLIVCEGDVVIGVNMLMVRYLTGKEAFLGDIYSLQNGILSLVHNCAPASLANNPVDVSINEIPAPESVGMKLKLAMCTPKIPLGVATLTRLNGPNCDQLHLVGGEVVQSEVKENTAAYIKLNDAESFLKYVCGNHYLLAMGNLHLHFNLLCEWLDLKLTVT
jgi:L-fucose isomerase-like protein